MKPVDGIFQEGLDDGFQRDCFVMLARSAAAGPRRQDQKRAKTQDAGSALDHGGTAGFQGLRRGAGNAGNAKRELWNAQR